VKKQQFFPSQLGLELDCYESNHNRVESYNNLLTKHDFFNNNNINKKKRPLTTKSKSPRVWTNAASPHDSEPPNLNKLYEEFEKVKQEKKKQELYSQNVDYAKRNNYISKSNAYTYKTKTKVSTEIDYMSQKYIKKSRGKTRSKSPNSQRYNSKYHEMNLQWKQNVEEKLQKERRKKKVEEKKNCSFHPHKSKRMGKSGNR